MTKDEAMKLALEALEHMLEDAKQERLTVEYWNECVDAITALREALAEQPAQPEPVAPKCGAIIEVFGKDWRLDYMSLPVGKHKLYTQQYTYTTPPQRKPLTDEEIDELSRTMVKGNKSVNWLCRAIEAAHGIAGEKPNAA